MGVVLAIASIVASAASAYSSHESAKAQEEAAEETQRQNAAATASKRRQSLREERVRRAQILAQAENTGVAGGSSAISGASMSGTIASEQMSSGSSMLARSNNLANINKDIAGHQADANMYGNVSSMFSSAYGSGIGDNLFE